MSSNYWESTQQYDIDYYIQYSINWASKYTVNDFVNESSTDLYNFSKENLHYIRDYFILCIKYSEYKIVIRQTGERSKININAISTAIVYFQRVYLMYS